MSQIIEKYHAAIVDCIILEDEFDSFMLMRDIDSAQGCLTELVDITCKWVPNIIGLRQVLSEKGNTASIPTLDYYLECFDEFNTTGLGWAEILLNSTKE